MLKIAQVQYLHLAQYDADADCLQPLIIVVLYPLSFHFDKQF